MKSILLHIHDDCALEDRLSSAIDIARAHHGHITCLQINSVRSYMIGDPLGGVYASGILIEALEESVTALRTRIELRLEDERVSWVWDNVDGEPADMLVDHGSLADVIVLSRSQGKGSERIPPLAIVADVAIHARAPVLVVPPSLPSFQSEGAVVIAWNGSIEAAHSLRLSLPLLRMASTVHIVTVSDDSHGFSATKAASYLSLHAIASEQHNWPREGRAISEALMDAAQTLQASCLVMGAYGHSRLREAVFGGATRDLLAHATVPLLLAH